MGKNKLAGVAIEVLKQQELTARNEIIGKVKRDRKREKEVIKRVKSLLPYENILGKGVLAYYPPRCPRCDNELKIEESWGWFSVFRLLSCNNCDYEYGSKHPKPSGGLD